MIGYKVVQKTRKGQWASFNYPYTYPYKYDGQSIIYKINKFTYPKIKGSKLFLFKHQIDAKNMVNAFSLYNSEIKIFRCEALNARPKKYISNSGYIDRLKDFWELRKKYTRIHSPKGTYNAEAIKLLEEVN